MDFQGSLAEFQLPDIVQFLSGARKTGVLRLVEGQETGEIFLEKGRIVHAVLGDRSDTEREHQFGALSQSNDDAVADCRRKTS